MVDESNLEGTRVSHQETHIDIANSRGVAPDTKQLEIFFKERLSQELTNIHIDISSHLESPWFVKFFPKLEVLIIRGKRVSTLEPLRDWRRPKCLVMDRIWRSDCNVSAIADVNITRLMIAANRDNVIKSIVQRRKFGALGLIGYQSKDCAALDSISVDELSFIGGHLVNADNFQCQNVRHLFFSDCNRLKSLGGIHTRELRIDNCRSLDLSSLSKTTGIVKLEIKQKSIESIQFCARLAQLEDLSLFTSTEFIELQALHKLPELKRIWISSSDHRMEGEMYYASIKNRRMIICNGFVCYQGGVQIPPAMYYEAEQA
jgi:hypothetical protein